MKQRESNFELLRMVSMVLIIGHHFAVHGGFYFLSNHLTLNMLFLQLLSIGGKIGVNLFVLISGYFTITSQGLRLEKVIKLWLQIFFYSVVIYLLACVTGLAAFSFSDLIKACLPILSKQWWFASAYFIVYLISPCLSRKLRELPQKKYRNLLAVVTVLWCLIPVLTWLPERLRDVLWFVYLYALAGYLRLYGIAPKRAMAAGLGCFVLTFCHSLVLLYLRTQFASNYETVYYNMYHLLILVTSVLLFLGFARLELPANPRINALAALSFGVYLIHDSDHLRFLLWRDLAACASFRDSVWLIPYALVLTAAVYLVCGGLEALRQRLLDKPFTALSQRIAK